MSYFKFSLKEGSVLLRLDSDFAIPRIAHAMYLLPLVAWPSSTGKKENKCIDVLSGNQLLRGSSVQRFSCHVIALSKIRPFN